MGFFAYSSPETTLADDSIVNNQSTDKSYFVLDDIEVESLFTAAPTITSRPPGWINDNVENISIKVKLNVYPSYEERLLRNNLLLSREYSLQDLIDKNFSENLWTKCYIKVKELLLDQNTQLLKETLNLRDNDTIPTQCQYLLEMEDHFN
tara:strand:+ start:553 stop:1002 length:450 start_codon:yes stop_codon:yes gene_type:complete